MIFFHFLQKKKKKAFEKLVQTLKVSAFNAEDFIYAEILNFKNLYRSNDPLFEGYKDTSMGAESSYGVIKFSAECKQFIGSARACIPDKAGKVTKDLEKDYPFLYPDDLFTSDIYDLINEEDPEKFIKEKMSFLSYEDKKASPKKAKAVKQYIKLSNDVRKAYPNMAEIVYKYRSVPRVRTLVSSRVLAHTLELMYGSHPASHTAEIDILGYKPEEFIRGKLLEMLQDLWTKPIISYMVTGDSIATKQLTMIFPTPEALEKDATMPVAFPLIVFTKHKSRFNPTSISSKFDLERLWFKKNSIFSMHSIFVTYYIPTDLSPRLLQSLVIKDSNNTNSFYSLGKKGIENLFRNSTNYLNRGDIVRRKEEILNRPASIAGFANLPKTEGGKYVDYDNQSFTKNLKE